MHPDVRIWLKDIELSIKEIHDFLPPNVSYQDFQDETYPFMAMILSPPILSGSS
jgi:hypothetical protein